MLNDDSRNAAYERAITRAVAARKQTHGEVRQLYLQAQFCID
jgi:hypothetical protein